MFDIFSDIYELFIEFINSLAQKFISYATEALDALGISEHWNDLLATDTIGSLLTYAPWASLLIDWNVILLTFSASFTIIISITLFKIIVKVIPTIY
jgi:hypothetical protein